MNPLNLLLLFAIISFLSCGQKPNTEEANTPPTKSEETNDNEKGQSNDQNNDQSTNQNNEENTDQESYPADIQLTANNVLFPTKQEDGSELYLEANENFVPDLQVKAENVLLTTDSDSTNLSLTETSNEKNTIGRIKSKNLRSAIENEIAIETAPTLIGKWSVKNEEFTRLTNEDYGHLPYHNKEGIIEFKSDGTIEVTEGDFALVGAIYISKCLRKEDGVLVDDDHRIVPVEITYRVLNDTSIFLLHKYKFNTSAHISTVHALSILTFDGINNFSLIVESGSRGCSGTNYGSPRVSYFTRIP